MTADWSVLEGLPIPLLTWYAQHARRLPWRDAPSAYHVWVSEIMLQQTRVAAVLSYYTRFMDALPTVDALAACPEDALLKLWQGLGYYSRARNLQKAAQLVVTQFGGELPNRYDALLSLPGVGAYTAGAIGSIAFGLPVPAVDGNVLRVTARLTGDAGDITSPAMRQKTADALRAILPVRAPGDFNQAMMELGATVCLPGGAPLCDACPAAAFCTARLAGLTGVLPVRAAKKARRVEARVVYRIEYDGRVALRRRPARGLLAGLWELPNEAEGSPDPLAAWGIVPVSDCHLAEAVHIFTHIEWHMTARRVVPSCGDLPDGWVWADHSELLRDYAVPNAFSYFLYCSTD